MILVRTVFSLGMLLYQDCHNVRNASVLSAASLLLNLFIRPFIEETESWGNLAIVGLIYWARNSRVDFRCSRSKV